MSCVTVHQGARESVLGRSGHDAGAPRYTDGLNAVVDAELAEDAMHVGPHGVDRQSQLRRHLSRGEPLDEKPEHVPFTRCQRALQAAQL